MTSRIVNQQDEDLSNLPISAIKINGEYIAIQRVMTKIST
jgi:hypothetical protein